MITTEWKFSARLAWQDLLIRSVWIVSGMLWLASSVFALGKLIPEGMRSGLLVMHYTMYLGIDDVRSWQWIFAVPAIMLGCLLLNAAVSCVLYRNDQIAARATAMLSAVLSLLYAVGVVFLVYINL